MRKISLCVLVVLAVSVLGLNLFSAQKSGTNPVVEKLDPALDAIVPANATLEILKGDYFGNIEGPLWIQRGQTGYLFLPTSALTTFINGRLTASCPSFWIGRDLIRRTLRRCKRLDISAATTGGFIRRRSVQTE